MNKIISRPLTDSDIKKFAQPLTNFQGVFMRNNLPKKRCPKKIECGVINLDNEEGLGTHWVGYYRYSEKCFYFDSFGNLQPPQEFINYIGEKCRIYYNYNIYQTFGTVNCGHLCMTFLYEMLEKFE